MTQQVNSVQFYKEKQLLKHEKVIDLRVDQFVQSLWVRAKLRSHVRQAKSCLPVVRWFFLGISHFRLALRLTRLKMSEIVLTGITSPPPPCSPHSQGVILWAIYLLQYLRGRNVWRKKSQQKFGMSKDLMREKGKKGIVNSRCPGWSESSLDAHVILMVLSCCGSYLVVGLQLAWICLMIRFTAACYLLCQF